MRELIDYIWNMPMWTFIVCVFVGFGILSDYFSESYGSVARHFKNESKNNSKR